MIPLQNDLRGKEMCESELGKKREIMVWGGKKEDGLNSVEFLSMFILTNFLLFCILTMIWFFSIYI